MAKVNRNDPCPCGSGKKYKNCCMIQDRISASRELNVLPGEAYTWTTLYRYAETPRLAGDLSAAFGIFWAGTYDLRGVKELGASHARRTFEWFTLDYRTSIDQRTAIDLFVETQTDSFRPEYKELLAAWAASVTGLFRVVGRSQQDQLQLYDLVNQTELTVANALWARNALDGDLLIARAYEFRGVWRLTPMSLALPSVFELDLVAYATNAFKLYRDEHPQATWTQFVHQNGHLFNAYLLSTRAEPFRSSIGAGTRYEDPADARDRLRAYTERSLAEARRERERAQSPTESRLGRRMPSGLIVPNQTAAEEETARAHILIPGRDT